MLDELGDVVRAADAAAWAIAYGSEVPTALNGLVDPKKGPLVPVVVR